MNVAKPDIVPSEEADFADRLEHFFRANYTVLVRRHLRYGNVTDVQDAIQDAMMRIYARFSDGAIEEPENLDAFVNAAVRNVLIDRLRQAKLVSIDEVMTASDGTTAGKGRTSDNTETGLSDHGLRDDDPGQEDTLAWKQLLHAILDRLPERWSGVAAMAMGGASPTEIGATYQRNGYVLRRYVRELICRVLHDLARGGDSLADTFGREFCG